MFIPHTIESIVQVLLLMFQHYNSSGLSVLVWFKQGAEAALELCVVVVQTSALRMRQCQSQQIGRMCQILSSKFYN